ncbi:MAG: GNAT family N-acetyltransferase [Thermoleophilaceae bacterium]|nr:GNAT family N-acetyltransferase [Thermoleophilaceae bacterium]
MTTDRNGAAPSSEADVVLRDGSTVHVRRVGHEDLDSLRAFLESLSPEARRLRFFTAGADVSGAARWAAAVGDRDGVGVLATVGDPAHVVGHADYERVDGDRAEIAFEVADALRGHGLATILMAHLASAARAAGISIFVAEVLPENRRMLDVFRESGFPMRMVQSPSGLAVELTTDLSEAALLRYLERERIASAAAVRHFLEPESVAVVGASTRQGSVGRQVLDSIIRSGFDGPLYPVNPRHRRMRGMKAYSSVTELPGPVELAIVATPAATVPAVARECALAGVSALLVLSGGFAEDGEEGTRRQEELVAACRAGGMRLIGPNCLGLTSARRPLDATFSRQSAPPGRVGLLSQSGGVGLALIERCAHLGLGLSSFVSIGNRADISANDVLEYWEDDDTTDAVLLYLESFGNPRNFARVARRLARTKPIAAVRAGRSQAGARAAASHTGAAVAASDAGAEALFRQAGIIRAETLGELFDLGTLLATQPLPRGGRVAIVTNAGGPAILCADACLAGGLEVPELTAALRGRLAEIAPPHASTANPVDLLAAATGPDLRRAAELLADSGEVDAVIALFTPALATGVEEVRRELAPLARESRLPLLAVLFGAAATDGNRGPAEFAYPESAARALARVAEYVRWREQPPGTLPVHPDVDRSRAAELLAGAVADGPRWLESPEVESLLGAWGIPLVDSHFARGPVTAGRAAADLGGKVVLKASASGLVHKTEEGAVELGLEGERAVREAAERMGRRLRRAGFQPGGFVVQRQAEGGVEMLCGIASDPALGALVVCGAGGTLADLLGDVQIRLAPVTDAEAARMVDRLRVRRMLDGYRGSARADAGALQDIITRLGRLAEAHPEVVELDCNPVLVGPAGATVLDARVRVAPPSPPAPWPGVTAEAPAALPPAASHTLGA